MNERVFYVSVINGKRRGLLRGPFSTHEEALDLVETVRAWVIKRDEWAHFYGFGTASIAGTCGSAPPGRLNAAMAEDETVAEDTA